MAAKRFAVVTCHVERLLDDRVWPRYRSFLQSRRGGFPITSLVRPPDESAGEDAGLWLERVDELAGIGPVGHHTHWTAPDHARPLPEANTAERVRREADWLRSHDVAAASFCGGGWYTDSEVAAACAELRYVDCTPRSHRPPRLENGGRWAELGAPAVVRTTAGELTVVPTTRSLGELARLAFRPQRIEDAVVHGYFHDTDLLDGRRRRALAAALVVLGRRRRPAALGEVAAALRPGLETVAWDVVARGGPADSRE